VEGVGVMGGKEGGLEVGAADCGGGGGGGMGGGGG